MSRKNNAKKKQFKVAHWNVNGLRAILRKKELQKFVQKIQPDILCLTETKLSLPDEKMRKTLNETFPQYTDIVLNTSSKKKGYSGVAVLSSLTPVGEIKLGIGATADDEGRTITIDYGSFVVIVVYTPNAGQGLRRLEYRTKSWDTKFRNYTKSLMDSGKPVVILGDLNCARTALDIVNGENKTNLAGYTPQERASFEQLMLKTKLIDSFRVRNPKKRQYTYWNYRTRAREKCIGWRIDYVLVDPRLKFVSPRIHDDQMGSDHAPISVSIRPYS